MDGSCLERREVGQCEGKTGTEFTIAQDPIPIIRTFAVIPVLNGYIVEIGCRRVVFTSRDSLMRAIDEYLNDPQAVEKHYQENGINAKYING